MKTKICSKCKIEKELTEFYKEKRVKDGRMATCKKCLDSQHKKYDLLNRIKRKIYRHNHYLKTKEKTLKQSKKYYLANKKDVLNRTKKYQKLNKNIISFQKKQYRQKHKKRIMNTEKIYKQNNKEKCKISQKNSVLKKRHGISLNDYNRMLEAQNKVCAICHNKDLRKSYLSVDHNHKTGKIRGLLCTKCNTGLGMFCDNKLNLYNAFKYLEKEKTND